MCLAVSIFTRSPLGVLIFCKAANGLEVLILSFVFINRASGRSREKKSNFAGFSGTNSRKNGRLHGNFAGIFEASFAEK